MYDFENNFCQGLVAWRQLGIWLTKCSDKLSGLKTELPSTKPTLIQMVIFYQMDLAILIH